MHWASGVPDRDEESALLEEIYNADAEIQRLAGVAPWPLAGQRRPLAGQRPHLALAAGGAAAVSEALTEYAGHRRRQGRHLAVAAGGPAAGMPRAAGWRSGDVFVAQRVADDAAVAAFEPLREREAQRERAESASSSTSPRGGRGRVIRPIVINDSSEDGG